MSRYGGGHAQLEGEMTLPPFLVGYTEVCNEAERIDRISIRGDRINYELLGRT